MTSANKPDGHVEVKNPAPAVIVGDIAAERRPDDRRQQRRDAEQRHAPCPCFSGGKRIEQHSLAGRLQSAAGQSLQHAEHDQLLRLVAMPHSAEASVNTAIESRK